MINLKRILFIGFVVMLLDQIIKIIVTSLLDFGQSITVIHNFFSISLLINTGGAFSIFQQHTLILIVVSLIIIYILYRCFVKAKDINKRDTVIYGILLGGICGNLFDRIFRGYVIDYLDFNIFSYNYPVFNFADICIVLSVFLIVILMYKGDKNDI